MTFPERCHLLSDVISTTSYQPALQYERQFNSALRLTLRNISTLDSPMLQLVFPDDRPCGACRPCSFNYALFRRSDVLPILTRVMGEPLDAGYLAATAHYPHFDVHIAAGPDNEARRFRAWCETEGLAPTRFCCMSEPRQEFWQAFASALGLPALSAGTARALRHKPTMKAWIRAAGLTTAHFGEIASPTDVERFAECYGFPTVVKPVDGWGALDTFVIKGVPDISALPDRLWQREMMIEAFVADREYECCALIHDGRVLDVYPSIMPSPPVEAARGAINANISLAGQRHRTAVDNLHGKVQSLVDTFGLNHGYLHMEFFASPDGSRFTVSELALRYPGCEIAKNHGLAYGFDVANATLDVYLGILPNLVYTRSRCVGDLLLPYLPGQVTKVSTVSDLLGSPGVIEAHIGVAVGDLLPSLADASFNCSGWAFVEGDTPEQVEQRMRRVLDQFRLQTYPSGEGGLVEGASRG